MKTIIVASIAALMSLSCKHNENLTADDINKKDKYGLTPLHWQLRAGT